MPTDPPPDSSRVEITRLLRAWQGGDLGARERLVEAVYAQVRAIAARSLRANPAVTLGATEVAHETLARLLGSEPNWEDRKHFFHVVAQATRQVLVDAARRRLAEKRGGGAQPISLSAAEEQPQADADLLRVHEALDQLAARDARKAQVLEFTYFVGLGREEIARTLAVSVPTVDRDLRFGKAWLKRALGE